MSAPAHEREVTRITAKRKCVECKNPIQYRDEFKVVVNDGKTAFVHRCCIKPVWSYAL